MQIVEPFKVNLFELDLKNKFFLLNDMRKIMYTVFKKNAAIFLVFLLLLSKSLGNDKCSEKINSLIFINVIPITKKTENQQWKHDAEKLIVKLQQFRDLAKNKKSKLRQDQSKDDVRESRSIDLPKSLSLANSVEVDHCLWKLWLSTGESPDLMKQNETFIDYVDRCLEKYKNYIEENNKKTDEQIVRKGLDNCANIMKTPLWYSAYQYSRLKAPLLTSSFNFTSRTPCYYIFSSKLSHKLSNQISDSYMKLLSKAKPYMKWNKKYGIYDISFTDSLCNKKRISVFLDEDEYEAAREQFLLLLNKLPIPEGTIFGENETENCEN